LGNTRFRETKNDGAGENPVPAPRFGGPPRRFLLYHNKLQRSQTRVKSGVRHRLGGNFRFPETKKSNQTPDDHRQTPMDIGGNAPRPTGPTPHHDGKKVKKPSKIAIFFANHNDAGKE
jgi:hypothetical protein